MFLCCECCVLSGRGVCVGLITRPEESCGCPSVVSVVCCQVEVSAMGWSLVQRSTIDVCLLLCCVLSGRGLCDGLIARPEESYGCLSVVSVVWCQVEVCATGWSLVQRSAMDVCCECCVLSGRGLCDELITRTEESYGYLSVVSVVCCQVKFSATSWSLVQRSPMDVSLLWVLCVVW